MLKSQLCYIQERDLIIGHQVRCCDKDAGLGVILVHPQPWEHTG